MNRSRPISVQSAARIALACLDLTSLNDGDSESDIERLCERAQGRYGDVAAVCVWPRFAAFARARLPESMAVAAVANFPDGGTDVQRARHDTGAIVDAGAQEVDVVLPYRALMAGDAAACSALLDAVRRACDGLVLKVILETGVLENAAAIRSAAQLALDAGADFLKTSTGKTPVSATLPAASMMLEVIAANPKARTRVGFKAAGGVRTVTEAARYIELTASLLGDEALVPARFRIGASGLLADIEAVLGHTAPSGPEGSY